MNKLGFLQFQVKVTNHKLLLVLMHLKLHSFPKLYLLFVYVLTQKQVRTKCQLLPQDNSTCAVFFVTNLANLLSCAIECFAYSLNGCTECKGNFIHAQLDRVCNKAAWQHRKLISSFQSSHLFYYDRQLKITQKQKTWSIHFAFCVSQRRLRRTRSKLSVKHNGYQGRKHQELSTRHQESTGD